MPTGGCFCDAIKVEYSGEPAMTVSCPVQDHRIYATNLFQALCHCADCRKISGGNYSNNIVVPSSNFKVTQGKPKEISKTADSGKTITSCFCGDCGKSFYVMRIGKNLRNRVACNLYEKQ